MSELRRSSFEKACANLSIEFVASVIFRKLGSNPTTCSNQKRRSCPFGNTAQRQKEKGVIIMSALNSIPDELKLFILSFLDIPSIGVMSRTSKRWNMYQINIYILDGENLLNQGKFALIWNLNNKYSLESTLYQRFWALASGPGKLERCNIFGRINNCLIVLSRIQWAVTSRYKIFKLLLWIAWRA